MYVCCKAHDKSPFICNYAENENTWNLLLVGIVISSIENIKCTVHTEAEIHTNEATGD